MNAEVGLQKLQLSMNEVGYISTWHEQVIYYRMYLPERSRSRPEKFSGET